MVDTTPLNQNPQEDAPGLENSTGPIAADEGTAAASPDAAAQKAPVSAAPVSAAPVSAAPASVPRSKRGLVLAGGIVAAVVVLGGIFGGGVLVGSSLTPGHGVTQSQRRSGGAGIRAPEQQGPTDGGNRDGMGMRPNGGPRGGSDDGHGSTTR
jgi:hypothetical protein